MNDIIFQGIYDNLLTVLPEKWEKTIFRCEYTEGSYSMKYYIKDENGEYKDCYKIGGASKSALIKTFINIDKMISPEREALKEKDRWVVMTMIISPSGEFNIYYEYEKASDSISECQRVWEEIYLK